MSGKLVWRDYVKSYAKKNGISFKQALRDARDSYHLEKTQKLCKEVEKSAPKPKPKRKRATTKPAKRATTKKMAKQDA